MTRRDNTTRWRAKGLWIEGFVQPPRSIALANPGLQGYRAEPLAAYKFRQPETKMAAGQLDLKPYWGKPAVRNFREGRGNGVASATTAPLLYSAD